jgi:phospholipid-binding lipoprotein MlaA
VRSRPALRATLVLVAALTLGACASSNVVTTAEPNDPLEPFNRAMFRINDVGDRYLLRPMAVGYTKGLPPQFQKGIHNAFKNALYPVTIANAFLQGKFRQTMRDGARFLVNTIIGLGGLFDPATGIGLVLNDEDFGQTLGVWGVAEGPFLVLPVFGPYTVRDLTGAVVDSPLTPFIGVTDGELNLALGAWVIYQVDRRAQLLEVDYQMFEAYDPYIFVRDAYLQNRRFRVSDGAYTEDDQYEELEDEAEIDAGEDGAEAPN